MNNKIKIEKQEIKKYSHNKYISNLNGWEKISLPKFIDTDLNQSFNKVTKVDNSPEMSQNAPILDLMFDEFLFHHSVKSDQLRRRVSLGVNNKDDYTRVKIKVSKTPKHKSSFDPNGYQSATKKIKKMFDGQFYKKMFLNRYMDQYHQENNGIINQNLKTESEHSSENNSILKSVDKKSNIINTNNKNSTNTRNTRQVSPNIGINQRISPSNNALLVSKINNQKNEYKKPEIIRFNESQKNENEMNEKNRNSNRDSLFQKSNGSWIMKDSKQSRFSENPTIQWSRYNNDTSKHGKDISMLILPDINKKDKDCLIIKDSPQKQSKIISNVGVEEITKDAIFSNKKIN